MEPTPSSGSEPVAPPTRRAAAVRAAHGLSRSRRVQTFGLGILCGSLGLSLLIVVTTIFAVSQRPEQLPADPATVSEERVATPAPPGSTPAPTPTPEPTVEPVDEVDAAPGPDAQPAPPQTDAPVPAPAPEPEPTPTATAPGNSGNAPGHNKKKP